MTGRRRFVVTLAGAAGALLCLPGARGATIPRPAGALPFQVGSNALNLAAYKGKVTVVEIILTTCPHCQHVAQILDRIYREQAGRPFQVVALAINDNPDVPGFIRDFNISFPVGTVKREPVYDFLQFPMIGVRMLMPQVVFIDAAGMIQEQHGGGDAIFKTPDDEIRIRAVVAGLLGPAKPAAVTRSAPAKGSPHK